MLRLQLASACRQLEDLLPLGIAGAGPAADFIDTTETAETDIVVEGAVTYAG
jgi:hypothetical protein